MRIALLADLHFGEEAALDPVLLLEDLRAAAPDAMLVAGDLTRAALGPEFAMARSFLDAIPCPKLVVPGNHDIPGRALWARFFHPRESWLGAALPGAGSALLTLDDLHIIGLDTLARAQPHADWSAGALGPTRLASLRELLDRAAPPCWILCHHPLLHPPQAAGRRGVRGGERALDLLRAHRAGLILSGHLHLPAVVSRGPSDPTQLVAPSALSRRGGGAAGWIRLDRNDGVIAVRLRSHFGGEWQERCLDMLREPALEAR